MEYDIKEHLGQQVEYFLNGFTGGDVGVMERAKNTILDIYKNMDDNSIVLSISDWDKKKQLEINKLWDKALEGIKTIAESKDKEELFVDIEEIRNDVIQALNQLEVDYWDSIRKLLLKNVSK